MYPSVVYPNVRVELAKQNWNVSRLANEAGIPVSTLHEKLKGKSKFTLDECLAIKRATGTDMSVESLFTKEG